MIAFVVLLLLYVLFLEDTEKITKLPFCLISF